MATKSDAVQWQPGSHGQNTAPKRKRGARREIPTGGCWKKKRRKEGRLVPGSAKMQSLIKWYVDEQTHKDNGSGQKRNARSVAEEKGKKKQQHISSNHQGRRGKWAPKPKTRVIGEPKSGTAAVSAGFGPQVQEQHVATPRSFGVLVRK